MCMGIAASQQLDQPTHSAWSAKSSWLSAGALPTRPCRSATRFVVAALTKLFCVQAQKIGQVIHEANCDMFADYHVNPGRVCKLLQGSKLSSQTARWIIIRGANNVGASGAVGGMVKRSD